MRSPSSRTSSPCSATFGTDLPAWTVYRSIEWPVRFAIGLYPKDSIVRSMVAPRTCVGTLGRTTSIAAWSAASEARINSVQFRVPISTVLAVSVKYPSTCAPRSIFTTSPRWRTRSSLCVGVSCAATSFTERHVGNAGGHPRARRKSSIRSTPSRIVMPSRSVSAAYARPCRAARPARRSFSTISSDKSKAFRTYRPFPYNSWLARGEIDDGRLLADRAWPRVEIRVHPVPELLLRLPRLDGRLLPVDVRARGGDGPELLRKEQRDGVLRHPGRARVLGGHDGARGLVGRPGKERGRSPGAPAAP